MEDNDYSDSEPSGSSSKTLDFSGLSDSEESEVEGINLLIIL
jgi:hypothetical protein